MARQYTAEQQGLATQTFSFLVLLFPFLYFPFPPLYIPFPFPSYLFIIITTLILFLNVNLSSILPLSLLPLVLPFSILISPLSFKLIFYFFPISFSLLYYIIISLPTLLLLPSPSFPLHYCFAAILDHYSHYYFPSFPYLFIIKKAPVVPNQCFSFLLYSTGKVFPEKVFPQPGLPLQSFPKLNPSFPYPNLELFFRNPPLNFRVVPTPLISYRTPY